MPKNQGKKKQAENGEKLKKGKGKNTHKARHKTFDKNLKKNMLKF